MDYQKRIAVITLAAIVLVELLLFGIAYQLSSDVGGTRLLFFTSIILTVAVGIVPILSVAVSRWAERHLCEEFDEHKSRKFDR